jgi:hypothetical protein
MITKYDKLSSGHCRDTLGDDFGLFKHGNLSLINAMEATPNVQFSNLSLAECFEDLEQCLKAFASDTLGKYKKAVAYIVDGAAKEKDCYADI